MLSVNGVSDQQVQPYNTFLDLGNYCDPTTQCSPGLYCDYNQVKCVKQDCKYVMCPMIACAPNEYKVSADGINQCCPICLTIEK